MSHVELQIIDFHNHHVPVRFEADGGEKRAGKPARALGGHRRKLSDEELLLRDIRDGNSRACLNIPAH